jgi:hypothetical protein
MTNEPVSPPDFHHVKLTVSKVSEMAMMRNAHQRIQAIVDVKLSEQQARKLMKLIALHLHDYREGMGPITFSLEGEFT